MNQIDKQDYSNNTELVTREKIENSPFEIMGMEGKYFGVMGKYRITKTYETKDIAKFNIELITWDRIVQVILILMEEKIIVQEAIKEELNKTK